MNSKYDLSHISGWGLSYTILSEVFIFTIHKKVAMSVIVILLIASISVAALFLAAFIWSVKNGQYDDEVSPAIRILFDDSPKKSAEDQNPVTKVLPVTK